MTDTNGIKNNNCDSCNDNVNIESVDDNLSKNYEEELEDITRTKEDKMDPKANVKVDLKMDLKMLTLDEEVKNYIVSYIEKKGYKDIKINVEPGCNLGDNFNGFIGKLTITAIDNNGENKAFNWIAKTAPNLEMHREALSVANPYIRESYIYTDVLPTFQAFQNEKRILEPFCEHPEFVLSYLEEMHESIVMENLKCSGYVMKPRQEPLDLNHVKLVMKAYAKLHAVSYALKDQKPDVFKKLAENTEDIVKNVITNEAVRQIQGMAVQFPLSVLNPKTEGNILAVYKKFADNYLDIAVKLLEETNERSVIGHGDCWVNNMLWKYELADETIPTKVCLLDWQMSRYGSPAHDLSYFMFTCTTKEFRDEHYDNMIKLYYYTLCAHVNELGTDPEKYLTFEGLLEELEKYSMVGMYMSMGLIACITQDYSKMPDINAEDSSVENVQNQMMAGIDFAVYGKRVKDVVVDGYEKGYFKQLM